MTNAHPMSSGSTNLFASSHHHLNRADRPQPAREAPFRQIRRCPFSDSLPAPPLFREPVRRAAALLSFQTARCSLCARSHGLVAVQICADISPRSGVAAVSSATAWWPLPYAFVRDPVHRCLCSIRRHCRCDSESRFRQIWFLGLISESKSTDTRPHPNFYLGRRRI